MSPYPSRVDSETIVSKAAELIESEGLDALSMQRLAAALDVKAPSLYRYFPGKNDLLRAVNQRTSAALTGALRAAGEATAGDPPARLRAMAQAYRTFAHQHPALYRLALAGLTPATRPDDTALEQMALPLQAAMAPLSGAADSLPALRGLWALLHGYVLLELGEQMRRGGDLDATFDSVVTAYLAGWIRAVKGA